MRRAFTLIEILVAVSVLTLLVVLASQMINATGAITRRGTATMNMDNCARVVFDRLSLDFSAMVNRADADAAFEKLNGSDRMTFYSQVSGFYPSGVTGHTPESPVTLVGYRINCNRLERLGKALVWNGVTGSTPAASGLPADASPMVFLPVTIPGRWNPFANGAIEDPDFQVLGKQVIRMEFCFLRNDGSFSGMFDRNRSAAAVVTIAVLDTQNAAPGPDLNGIANGLPDGDDPCIADSWASQADAMAATRNCPAPNIRIYQRYFPLGTLP